MYNTKGTDIMNRMLLQQYDNSPNLKEYLGAYISEMDLLFTQIEEVYLGRLLDTAIGAQLDIIGRILKQSRNLPIPNEYFGFQGATGAKGFGEEGNEPVGGVFKSEGISGFTVEPLDDTTYRKILRARGYALVKEVWSVEDVYKIVDIIIGLKVKKRVIESSLETILMIDTQYTTNKDFKILNAIKHWFTPIGLILSITTL